MLELTGDGRETLEKIIATEGCNSQLCIEDGINCKKCPLEWFNCGNRRGDEVNAALELLGMIDDQKDDTQC